MPAKVYSAATLGLNSYVIEVEADILASSAAFFIVGLPDTAVQESKERVRSAIKNCDLPFPRTRVVVNLAPADLKKAGPSFDLPIAMAVLLAKKFIKLTPPDQQALFIGELSLDGSLKPVNGILAMADKLAGLGFKKIYLPSANAAEAALINKLAVYPVFHLKELIKPFKKQKITKLLQTAGDSALEQIKGQAQAKRALIIAAAGYHNLLMFGPPGTGKTLLARALRDLLPPLSLAESLEVTKIYSLTGLLPEGQPLITARPFRSPHHTASGIALVGGGSNPKPGEITLAHRGILFLDELPEFPKTVLENLRQPLEDGIIAIARAATAVQFPARFTLIATANPCPCGFLGDTEKPCRCTMAQIQRYQKKLSGPLLDRIDLQINVPRVNPEELFTKKDAQSLNSKNLPTLITQAQGLQAKRLKKFGLRYNAEITHELINKFCPLNQANEQLLKQAVLRLQLSARACHKVLKVARTIADLEQSEAILPQHLAESLQYRQNILQ